MGNLKGVYIVLATPFTKEGEIDYDGFGRNLDHYVAAKVHGVLVAGALGEYLTMTIEERKALVEFAAKRLDGKIPFMVGAVAHRPHTVIELSNHAKDNDASGVMILPPPGTGLLYDEIKAFYSQVAANINIPVLLYNNPGSSGMDMDVDFVRQLAELPNMDAIKESSGDITRISRIKNEFGDKLTPFCGWEDMHLESFCAGAEGWVCMGANFAPGLTRDILDSYNDGNMEKARALSASYNPLAHYMEFGGKVIQTTKYVMEKQGLAGGYARAPRQGLTQEEKNKIDAILANVKLY